MSPRPSLPANRPAAIALCMIMIGAAIAVLATANAQAANYKMVLCAGNNGSNSFDTATNTRSAQNPGGIFNFENYCGPAPDPAGGSAFLRIAENQGGGPAGESAYGAISWTVPPWVAILGAGGYTRMPESFNEGWRGRFWAEDFGGGGPHNILMQGTNATNSGISWWPTSVFASHLWPFSGYGFYRRFIFELTCMRPGGCDRSGFNAVDANSFTLILDDVSPAQVIFINADAPLASGQWVRGVQSAYYNWTEQGSGIGSERLTIDGAERFAIDHVAAGQCDVAHSQASGEFARVFQPCPAASDFTRSHTFDTAWLADGAHAMRVCVQDYAQRRGHDGTGSETCDQRTIRTDNNAPGAPSNLQVTSANPQRYLDRFGASFSLPPNQGSPIAKVHYQVIDAKGAVVKPTTTLSVTDPTSISGIEGPKAPGDYRLRLWLEDQVGHVGPAATALVPRDTTPPAAPQDLRVAGPSERWVEQLNLRWRNAADAGSPIVAARYRVIDSAGAVIAPPQLVSGENPEGVDALQTPPHRGDYRVEVWLADEEGNVGVPAAVALPRDTTPPAAPQELSVTAPSTPRSAEGFDLRWRNIADGGSPIEAAHYRVRDGAGEVVVPARALSGSNPQAIESIDAPSGRGPFTLDLWLSDAEGNVGAPVSAPLAYDCVRSPVAGGRQLATGLDDGSRAKIVNQGQGASLLGHLRGETLRIPGAPICVFSQVDGADERDFLGLAITDPQGEYRFAIGAGPSRALSVVYRPDQRALTAEATLRTRVKPTLRAARQVVRTGQYAQLSGEIPGPRNDDVLVVLQVRQGNGWLAFRRYRTRGGGRFEASYLFRRTTRPTTYEMRAQVREAGGYPYLEGDSDPVYLRVLPKPLAARKACPAGKRWVKQGARSRCVREQGARGRCAKAKRPGHGARGCARSKGRHGQAPRARSASR